MSAVIEQNRENAERQRAAAERRYIEIVQRADAPLPADVADLPSVLATIGKTEDDFEGLVALVKESRKLAADLPEIEKRAAEAEGESATARSDARREILAAVVQKLESENDIALYRIFRNVAMDGGGVPSFDSGPLHRGNNAEWAAQEAELAAKNVAGSFRYTRNRLNEVKRQLRAIGIEE